MRRFLWLAALCLSLSAETTEDPYFSLSSSATFATGEAPKVDVSVFGATALEFRVYKINDPVAFFGKLEDAHMFGGRAPKPPLQKSWLESFHRWKREWRVDTVNFLHDQFSRPTIQAYQDWRSPKPASVDKNARVDQFATPPLLNPRQLVASWRQQVSSKDRWQAANIPIPVKDKGVYLVEAARGQLRAFTILMVTDLALIAKTTEGQVQVYVANRQTGAPSDHARVLLATGAGKDAAPTEAFTGHDGLVKFQLKADRGAEPQVMALAAGDFAVNSIPAYSLQENAWLRYRSVIYSDRPVYRPGHQVFFKAVVREKLGSSYRPPQLRDIDVEIHGPNSETVFKKTLPVTSFGSVSGEMTLAPNAALGYYNITLLLGQNMEQSGSFEVQEYKKPEYEVRVTTAQKRILQGGKFEALVDAHYFFGEPVMNASVKYVLRRHRYYSPLLWDPSDFEGGDDQDGGDAGNDAGGSDAGGDAAAIPGGWDPGQEASEHTGKLDANGQLSISLPIPIDDKKADYVYVLEAGVTDAGNREISGTGYTIATYGSFMIRLTPDRYFGSPGSKVNIKVRAIDYDGKPIATRVDLKMLTWDWMHQKDSKVVGNFQVQTDANGDAVQPITLPQGERFKIVGSARTPEGRIVENETFVYSWGGINLSDDAPTRQKIEIIPDKKTYQPGETAHILLAAGAFQGTILAGVEGRTLSRLQTLDAPNGTATLDVSIGEDAVPDFFITATMLHENRLYQGSKRISVPAAARKLNIKITPSKPQYIPGEAAEYTVEAKDVAGKPVSSEISLGIVDEAIYGVRTDDTPDMLGVFYRHDYNIVNTSDSLSYYFHGEAGRRRMELAQLHHGRALAQLKPERLVLPKIRKAFPDTVFWQAALTTNADGIAKAKLTFPDSITTFRATARAITQDTKVGSAINKTIVRKNIILRLVIPRFFVQGDEITISAVVHNYLPTAKNAHISMDFAGLEAIGGATREINIPSRGETKVDWRVRAKQLGDAKITGKALTDEESDAVEMTVPVEAYGVRLNDARNGALSDSANTDQTLTFPKALVPGSQSMEIRIAPSVAGAIFGALNYLTDFPYGCTEQTLSSFVPNIVVSRALRDLGVNGDVNRADLQAKITAGLDRLKDFQHPDGGWGWWKTDDSEIFMTASVVAGLSQARAAGLVVPGSVTARGAKWLKQAVIAVPRLAGDLHAYSAYALALAKQADPAFLQAAAAKRSDMTAYGIAMLGLAFQASGNAGGASSMATALEGLVKADDLEAFWQSDRDNMLDIYTDTSSETTAQAMRLLIATNRANPLIPKAAAWLLNHRREGAWWDTTKQTAMVVYGLTDYLALTGELKPDIAATVTLNGKKISAHTFQAEDALKPSDIVLRIPAGDLNAGANTVHVESEGKGRLYWSVRSAYVSSEPKLAKTGTVALNLLRDYFKLVPTQQGDTVVHTLTPITGTLSVGDTIAVRITVTGGDWRYLLMEDPIPAGMEFVENDRAYHLSETPPWWRWSFSRREFHDDRAALFQTHFYKGQDTHFYLLKVVNPGLFHISPAKVQPMYQPGIFSTSEALTLEAK